MICRAAMFGRISRRLFPARLQIAPLFGAIALFVVLGSYGDFYNYRVHFGPYLADITAGEVRLWLASVLITLPACWLVLQSSSAYWEPWVRAVKGWFERANRKQVVCATLFTAVGVLFAYRLLRWVLLRDNALTDDETVIRFGGQIMASGHLSVPKLWPYGTLTELYTVTTNGRIFSMDWPGGLAFSALSQVTRLGPWLYALFAAATFAAVVMTAARLWGVVSGVIAAVLWVVSPMAWTLSITEHTHIVSRACVAGAFLAATMILHPKAEREANLGWGALLGAAAGYSLATRPYETMSSLAPLAVYLAVVTARNPKRYWRQALVATVAFVPLALAYGAYNHTLTGSAFLTPRAVPWATDAQLPPLGIWHRMGQNLAHNWLMLGVWVGGLFAFPLSYLGLRYADNPTKPLRMVFALGAVAQLLTALGHENLGIHIVGPIHYSETVSHFVLLMTAGVLELRRVCQGALASRALQVVLGGHTAMVVVAGVMYGGSLINIGKLATIVPRAVREHDLHHAIVAAPTSAQIHAMSPNLSGSWQLVHPPPDPWLKDDIIYTYLEIPREMLLDAFPDRKLYVATYNPATMGVTFELVTKESLAASAKPAPKPPQPRRRRTKAKSESAKPESTAAGAPSPSSESTAGTPSPSPKSTAGTPGSSPKSSTPTAASAPPTQPTPTAAPAPSTKTP